jgi:putative addiction module killer protein
MTEVRQTEAFLKWIGALRDDRARKRIVIRIRRLELGNPGDIKPVGGGVSEMRIPYGPGYRIYFTRAGETIVILLCGGAKSSQARDIAIAQQLAKEI